MTHLQVAYQQVEEAKRANRMQEALKQSEITLKDRETQIKEAKLPAEVKEILSKSSLNDAQTNRAIKELDEIEAKIANIKANTRLTEVERDKLLIEAKDAYLSYIHRVTGLTPPGDILDFLGNQVSNVSKGIGKGVGKALGGLIA